MERLTATYRRKDNRVFYEENERVYDGFLNNIFGTFVKHQNNPDYYVAIFKRLDGLSGVNSKIFSQLKHLSYELSANLSKAGKTIHRISALYSQYIKESIDTYSKTSFKIDSEVDAVTKKLKVGLNEWGSQLLAQSRFVVDNMASFFHYKKHENLSFSQMIAAKIEVSANYKKLQDQLDATKKKLFDSKNTDKWKVNFSEIQGDYNELFKDFEKIKPYMIPEESRPVDELKVLNSFLNKHILFEYHNFYTNSQFYIKENFGDFSEKMMESFGKGDLLWNIFNKRPEDLSVLDRESTVTIRSLNTVDRMI